MTRTSLVRVAALILLATGTPTFASAQPARAPSAQTPPVTPTASSWAVRVGYEWHRDRFRYEFENPSTFDTPFLVPHTFAQAYVADNQWLVLSARYRLRGERLESEFGLTPNVTASASDIDTFLNPGGDVVTSGTDGDARMRAWRFAQWSEGRLWGVPVRVGYRYRRDEADFLPADIVVTRSQPPSVSRRLTTDRERTIAQLHEVPLDVSHTVTFPRRWEAIVGASVSPLVFARLTTILPEKYREPVVAEAKAVAADARIELRRRDTRWPLSFGLGWGKSWSYKASRHVDRDALRLSMQAAFRPSAN